MDFEEIQLVRRLVDHIADRCRAEALTETALYRSARVIAGHAGHLMTCEMCREMYFDEGVSYGCASPKAPERPEWTEVRVGEGIQRVDRDGS